MRPLLFLPLILLAACGDTRLPVTDGRITTLEQFQVTAAGNQYTARDLSLAIRDNGTFTGRAAGQDVAGRWAFSDGLVCFTRTEPQPLPTDCQIWEVKGNAFTVRRNGGSGPSTTYLFQYPLPPSYEQRVGIER